MRKISLICTLIIIIIISNNLIARNIDTLRINKIEQSKYSVDSLSNSLILFEKKLSNIESKIAKYEDAIQKPIQVQLNESIWASLLAVLGIILSSITLIYVVIDFKVNSIFGSYRGKKRYQTLEKEILVLNIKLEDIKLEFNDFINSSPQSFVTNGKKDLESLKKLIEKVNQSEYFTYAQDSRNDGQELIYTTSPNNDIVYRFNSYVEAMIMECKHIISLTEKEIAIRIAEAREIKYGEK